MYTKDGFVPFEVHISVTCESNVCMEAVTLILLHNTPSRIFLLDLRAYDLSEDDKQLKIEAQSYQVRTVLQNL